jgi:hypothetical protein
MYYLMNNLINVFVIAIGLFYWLYFNKISLNIDDYMQLPTFFTKHQINHIQIFKIKLSNLSN